GECQPGEARCPEEGGGSIEFCFGGAWRAEECAENGVCFNDQCLPDPSACVAGERICLGSGQPAVCNPAAGQWQPQAPCGDDAICVAGECVSAGCARAARDRSYLGCDYVAIDLPNSAFALDGTTPDAPTGVVVANPDQDRPVRVSVRDPRGEVAALVASVRIPVPEIPEIQGLYQAQTVTSEVRDGVGRVVEQNLMRADGVEIPPGGTATFLLPRITRAGLDSVVGRLAFRLQTDNPVAAYQFSPLCCNFSFSNDASLLVPVTALDTEYRFVGPPGWTADPFGIQPGNPQGIAIIAVEDGTDVTVQLPAGGGAMAERSGRMRIAGGQATARLDAQEVLLIQSRVVPALAPPQPDLSGSTISASARVAVFATHQCTFYPETLGACDHVEEQLFPVSTWGEDFVLVPPVRRGREGSAEAVYWKIAATAEGTRIELSRPFRELRPLPPGATGVPDCGTMLQGDAIVLRGTTYCEFGTFEPVGIQADGPLTVMGIISGQGSTGIAQPFGTRAGDPAIFLVPPDRQYRAEYAFLAPGTYANDYLTIVADADTEILLDDEPVNLAQGATRVPGTNRVFKHVPLDDGAHRVTGDAPFGVLVFAFDDFVSYAFTGGLNLEKR
ncbi:MAG: IgGFc-binding protein, partial [Myxococcales bacterium]|nr:IgGFc-binding protein [Myxococcales bacterium]